MGILSFILGSDNKRSLKKLEKIAVKVEALSDVYASKSDEELAKTTLVLKERLEAGETLNDILPDAYALVREASTRVLGKRHFHVQILGGIALHQGRIAQMRTGEGKTLCATLPAYLNALTGKGVHVVTVNEYLAKTQAEEISKLYNFLGVSVGIILSGMTEEDKRKAYNADITYGTNNEFGFDYLRDNMVITKDKRVQREFNFAIVDEVDSILIDEARTPLIISGAGMKSSDTYITADHFARNLFPDDYEINEKIKSIILTASGVEKAEKYFKIDNISDVENMELNHYINNALRARYIMVKDSNYMIQNNEIIIVDEFTGRAMPGRRYSDGLHQAIEAKEGVPIKNENKTLATITFQNFFRLYKKLSGMTGTAKTEEIEFNKIYNLDVVVIPTNKPMIRKDYPDIIYKTEKAKINAVVDEIERVHKTGRPILVGTVTIEKSEEISHALKLRKISHHVLNAKSLELEGELVAQAGRLGSVTVSTNMAGRGTDILLGGNPEFMARKKLKDEGYSEEQINLATSYATNKSEEILEIKTLYDKYYSEFKEITDKEKVQVVELGGLHILGTERHESRRIDDQLRGRAGRQGDPGSSVFYISMEDDLTRRFGGDTMLSLANSFKIADDVPFQLKMLSRGVESAQKRIEGQNFGTRRAVLQYDDVMNLQRFNIYAQRNEVLDGNDVHDQIVEMIKKSTAKAIINSVDADKPYFQWNLEDINHAIENKLLPKGTNLVTEEFVEDLEVNDLVEKVTNHIIEGYEEKIKNAIDLGVNFGEIERIILLRVVDMLWMDHIDAMSILKNEISLKAYGQQDPVAAYKRQGMYMFDNMIERIWDDVSAVLLNVDITKVPTPQKQPTNIITNEKTSQAKANNTAKRNDPCPCGSGKKYKNCCGK